MRVVVLVLAVLLALRRWGRKEIGELEGGAGRGVDVLRAL
jgi:hypothetical protein